MVKKSSLSGRGFSPAPSLLADRAAPVILTPRFFWRRISLLECGGLPPLCLRLQFPVVIQGACLASTATLSGRPGALCPAPGVFPATPPPSFRAKQADF